MLRWGSLPGVGRIDLQRKLTPEFSQLSTSVIDMTLANKECRKVETVWSLTPTRMRAWVSGGRAWEWNKPKLGTSLDIGGRFEKRYIHTS